jgi:hypothetical protein
MSAPRLALLEVIGRDGRVSRAIDVQHWPLTLGRSLANDVVLDDPFVAAQHATLALDTSGQLTLQVGDTDNGVAEGRQQHARGAMVPVPAGGTVWQLGGLTLKLRTPDEPLAAELPLPRQGRRAWAAPAAMALAFALMALWGHWLALDPGAEAAEWWPLVAGVPMAVALWCGLWALASKLFQHQFAFAAHLRLVLPWLLAIEAVDLLLPPLAAALGWPLLWRLATPLQLLMLAWLVWQHLVLVLPGSRRVLAVFVGAAVLGAGGVAVADNLRDVDRASRAPYMSTLPTPGTVWHSAEPPEALVQQLAPLAEGLAARVKKARAEEPPEEGVEE